MTPTPQPWDWTQARARVAEVAERGRIGDLDQALAQVRGFLDVEQVPPDQAHAASLWVGARLAIDLLTPLLRMAAGADPAAYAHITSHIDAIEEIACAAHDLWPAPAWPARLPPDPDPPAGPAGPDPDHER